MSLVVLMATGCSDRPGGERPAIPVAPAGEAFYEAPFDPDRRPGEVVWAARVDDAPANTRGWRILYGSETVQGEPIAVSGLLFVPDPLPDDQPLPVLALAHGTTGLGDRCAPSRRLLEGRESEVSSLPPEVLATHVVVATDYEGLGTPGVHPYLVGLSSARSVLDSIRAAQNFAGAGASAKSPSIVFGHSQGGGAALVAGEIAREYAPDVNLRGVAAGAPAGELKFLASALNRGPYFGFVLMAAAGFKAGYPELDLAAVLSPEGIEAADRIGGQCVTEIVAGLAGANPTALVRSDPGTTEPISGLLELNSPGARASSVPVFIFHGEADELIPVATSKMILDRYCANGTTAFRKTYAGENHGSVVRIARADITAYLADRLAGRLASSSC